MKPDETVPDRWQKMLSLTWGVINEIAEECFHVVTYHVPVKFIVDSVHTCSEHVGSSESKEPRGDGRPSFWLKTGCRGSGGNSQGKVNPRGMGFSLSGWMARVGRIFYFRVNN